MSHGQFDNLLPSFGHTMWHRVMGLTGYCPGGGYIPDAAVTKTNAKITIFGWRQRKIRVFTIFVYFLSSFVLVFDKQEFKSCKYIETIWN